MSKYGAYRVGNTTIGITKIPNRKQPALFIKKGNVIYPIAYMKNENAEMLMEFIKEFIERW